MLLSTVLQYRNPIGKYRLTLSKYVGSYPIRQVALFSVSSYELQDIREMREALSTRESASGYPMVSFLVAV